MNNDSRYNSLFKGNAGVISGLILSLIFIAISVALYEKGGSYMWLLPPALLIAAIGMVYLDKLLYLTVLLVPLSVQLIFIVPDSPLDLFLPTELILAGILLIMLFKLFISREISRDILRHPVTIIAFLALAWSLITSLYSTMPLVSLKSFLTKLWFFAAFYLLAAQVFKSGGKIGRYFSLYLAGMIPVIVYYLFRMWQSGIFNQRFAYKAIRPFFNDHTAFGAALAFCIPLILFMFIRKKSFSARTGLILLLILFVTGFVFCYSRAAWLSLAIALAVATVLLLRISWKLILPTILVSTIFLFISFSDILIRIKGNKQDSSDNLKKHIESISNIRSDASNVERLNRWNCAIRMFREKPVAGWGPATYQFNYAPFQVASEKTIISTNYGDWGNAHSEYLGALVDSGLPGLLFYLLLLIIPVYRGIFIWKKHPEKETRYLALAIIAGLTTYVLHGALNNFLDTDKISVLFWGMIAALVAIDIEMKKAKEEKLPEIGSDN